MAINKGYLTAKTDKASDEVFTPKYAVTPLLKYLSPTKYTIWCPFDTEDSNYVKVFKEAGHSVIVTHIDNGQNFFTYAPEPEDYDIIISNPPFSVKDDIIKRLEELNKPFAILLPLPALQGQKRFSYLKKINDDPNRGLQLIIFDKRINYYKDKEMKEIQKGVSFASIYLCSQFIHEKEITDINGDLTQKTIFYEELDTSKE